ncbi:MAG TPA: hypothetical protein VJ602_04615 [Paludibacter sp.]|nr:hypothetical protein [Paludibacter sp.]
MFNDNDDDLGFSEFEIWYDDNFGYFKRGAENFFEPDLDVEFFYTSIYTPFMAELPHAIRKLITKHYPIIDTECRPAVLEAIERKIKISGHSFLLQLYDLMQDKKEGINLREKYPDFEKWEQRNRESEVINRSVFESIEGLTAKQKDELYELAKREFPESYNYKDQRRYEFIELFQPVVFRHYPAIQELDSDGWVVYNYLLTIEHTEFRLRFEYFDEFIEYGFPEEDLYIPYSEFHSKLMQKFDERREEKKKLLEGDSEDFK